MTSQIHHTFANRKSHNYISIEFDSGKVICYYLVVE